MPTSLRHQLNELASSFANNVLAAIRSASLDDLYVESGRRVGRPAGGVVGAPGRKSGRLPRRSAADIDRVLGDITDLLRKGPKEGMRAEVIRQKLGMQAKEMPRPLKEGVAKKILGKVGNKRATTYFLKGAGGAAPKAARAAKPARKKK